LSAFLASEYNSKYDIRAINVDDALEERAVKSLGDIWLKG